MFNVCRQKVCGPCSVRWIPGIVISHSSLQLLGQLYHIQLYVNLVHTCENSLRNTGRACIRRDACGRCDATGRRGGGTSVGAEESTDATHTRPSRTANTAPCAAAVIEKEMAMQAVSLTALVAGAVAVPQLGSSKQQPLAGFILGRSIGATWEAVNDPVMVRHTVC